VKKSPIKRKATGQADADEAAKRDPSMQQLLPLLGTIRNATSEKAKRMIGWSPRSNEEAVVATAESLMRFGLLKRTSQRC